MRAYIEAVGVMSPGLPDWSAAQAVLARTSPFVDGPLVAPVPESLAPAERRRSSPTVRLTLAVAEQALRQTTRPAADMAMVFSSYEAAGVITHQLCEVLASTREVSPTQFHNSVHNAPSGYYSIAMGAKRSASSICRGKWSFAAGLLNATAQALADDVAVLFLCYDSPLPVPLCDVMPVTQATAIALVISPAVTPDTLAGWDVTLSPGPEATAWPGWIPPRWHPNASARGFAALATLADPACSVVTLPLSPELNVQVARC